MAGEWIKMRADLPEDPAVFRMAEMLEEDEHAIIGRLFCFWAWADKHAVDGRVDGASSRLVDKVTTRTGFADAMTSVGWLIVTGAGLQIPNFDRHNGESAKERTLKNARQARWRLKKASSVDASPSTPVSTPESTREEKRREEKKEQKSSCRFRDFWAVYPKHEAKKNAEAKWRSMGLDAKADEIIADVKRRKSEHRTWLEGLQYVPLPTTYLNGERWTDEIDTRRPATSAGDDFNQLRLVAR